MSFHRSKVDLLFSDSGDFSLDSKRGDISDTTELLYRAFIQQILTRIESSRGDWKLEPNIGANLLNFAGKVNTPVLGNSIRLAVVNSLIQDSFIKSSELKVEVFPVSKTNIAILVLIQPKGVREQIRLAFTYDTKDNKIIPRNS